jgi:hypothetical protein
MPPAASTGARAIPVSKWIDRHMTIADIERDGAKSEI